MGIFKIIFLLIAIIFPVAIFAYLPGYLKSKYIKKRDKSSFLNPFRHKSIIIVLILITTSFFVVNIFLTEPQFEDPYQKIKYGTKRNLPSMVKSGYEDLLNKDFKNIDLHYNYINWHFKQAKQYKKNNTFILRNDNDIFQLYNYLKLYNNDTIKQIGIVGHAYCLFKINKFSKAIWELRQSEFKNYRFKNHIVGKSYFAVKNYERAEKYFLKEIKTPNGYNEEAISTLVKLFIKEKEYNKIKPFIINPNLKRHISNYDLKNIYAINFNLIGFVENYIKIIYNRTDIIGLIAALLICITWLYYIKRIDIYEPEKWHHLIMILFLGIIFSAGSNFFSTVIRHYFDFNINGNILNDFAYTTLINGAIEEIFKILPLLLLLFFTKIINEPYDYILFASTAALGFALIENLIYFETASLHIVHGRALISVVGHMVNSSIIAYGLILAKYKKKMNYMLAFTLYFLIASLVHGTYNFLLIYNLQFIFVLFYLFCIKVWVTFINNALNNSKFFDYHIKMKSDKLQFYLVTSLTGILIFEYITIGWIYGANAANNAFIETSATGSILILFLSTRLSKFDLVKKHWNIIDYRINPFLFKTYPLNFVGYRIQIESYYQSNILGEVLSEPIKGKIIDRIMVHNELIWSFKKRKTEKNWFLIQLDVPVKYKKYNQDFLLLKFRSKQPKLKKEKDLLAKLLFIKDVKMLNKSNVSREHLKRMGVVIVNLIAID